MGTPVHIQGSGVGYPAPHNCMLGWVCLLPIFILSGLLRPAALPAYSFQHSLELSLQALSIFKDPSWKLSMASVQSN